MQPPLYKDSFEELRLSGVQSPEKDFEIFIQENFNDRDIQKYLKSTPTDISHDVKIKINSFFEKRKNRVPIERIINKAKFKNINVTVNDHSFKPGFETETMVDHASEYLKNIPNPHALDCGTGTGCILLSLLYERSDATGVGFDIDQNVIDLAQQNAQKLTLNNRCNFMISDWGDGLNDQFDLIISNPPRIPTDRIKDLVKEVALYDPHIALDGGKNGIDFYTRTAKLMRSNGKSDAVCIIQVGDVILKDAIRAIKREGFTKIKIGRDYKYSTNCLIFLNCDYKRQDSFKNKFLYFFGEF